MYVANSIYAKTVECVNIPDIDFFRESLNLAIEHVNPDLDKSTVPVVFVSALSKPSTEELSYADRKKMYDKSRIRRKFIMIDADFETGQEEESQDLIDRFVAFADEHNTPYLVYPTPSYPTKPRFRAVLFTKRVMNADGYDRAVRWLYRALRHDILDLSDVRLSANRNLPAFSNLEQVENVLNGLDFEDREPLDNKLWKDEPLPKKKARVEYEKVELDEIEFTFNVSKLEIGAHVMKTRPIAQKYESFWRVVQSLALAVLESRLDEDDAYAVLDILAEASEEKYEEYKIGNREMFIRSFNTLQEDANQRVLVRPLETYSEFRGALEIDIDSLTD